MNLSGSSGVYDAMNVQAAAPDLVDLAVDITVDEGTSFEQFYRAHYVSIARALSYTLTDVELGREAADEAMVRAYVHWKKIHSYDNPAAWVYRVGLNWARSARRRVTRALPFHERRDNVDPPMTDPALYAALQALDVRLRSVVVCRVLLDWSVEQTASALGIKPGTVKSRLHRALDSLEQTLRHLR